MDDPMKERAINPVKDAENSIHNRLALKRLPFSQSLKLMSTDAQEILTR